MAPSLQPLWTLQDPTEGPPAPEVQVVTAHPGEDAPAWHRSSRFPHPVSPPAARGGVYPFPRRALPVPQPLLRH